MTDKSHKTQRSSPAASGDSSDGHAATHWRARLGLALGLGVPVAMLIAADPAAAEPSDFYGGMGSLSFDEGANLGRSFGATFDDVSVASSANSSLGSPFDNDSLMASGGDEGDNFSLVDDWLDEGQDDLAGNGFSVDVVETNVDGKDFDLTGNASFVPFTSPMAVTLDSGVPGSGDETLDSSDNSLVLGGSDGLASDGVVFDESEANYGPFNNSGDVDTRDHGSINFATVGLPDFANESDRLHSDPIQEDESEQLQGEPPEGDPLERDMGDVDLAKVDFPAVDPPADGADETDAEVVAPHSYDEYGINLVQPPTVNQTPDDVEPLPSESAEFASAEGGSSDVGLGSSQPDEVETPPALTPIVVGENGSYDLDPLVPRPRYEPPLDATQMASKVGSFLVSDAAADADVIPDESFDPRQFSSVDDLLDGVGAAMEDAAIGGDATDDADVGVVAAIDAAVGLVIDSAIADADVDPGDAPAAPDTPYVSHGKPGPVQYKLGEAVPIRPGDFVDPQQHEGVNRTPSVANTAPPVASNPAADSTAGPSEPRVAAPTEKKIRKVDVPILPDDVTTDKPTDWQMYTGAAVEGGGGVHANIKVGEWTGSARVVHGGKSYEQIKFTSLGGGEEVVLADGSKASSLDGLTITKDRPADFSMITGRLKHDSTGATLQRSNTNDIDDDGKSGRITYSGAGYSGYLENSFDITTMLYQWDNSALAARNMVAAGASTAMVAAATIAPNRFILTSTETSETDMSGSIRRIESSTPHVDIVRTNTVVSGERHRRTVNLTSGYGGSSDSDNALVAGGEGMTGPRLSESRENHKSFITRSDRPGLVREVDSETTVTSVGWRLAGEVMGSGRYPLTAVALSAYGRGRGEAALVYNWNRSSEYESTTTEHGEVRAKSNGTNISRNGIGQKQDTTAFYEDGQITNIKRQTLEGGRSRTVQGGEKFTVEMDRTVVNKYTREIKDPDSLFDGDKTVTVVETLNPVDGTAEVVETSEKRSTYEDVDKTRTTNLDRDGNGTITEVVTTDRLGYRREETKKITINNGTQHVSEDVKVSGALAPDVHRISTQTTRPGGRVASTESVFEDGFIWDTTLNSFTSVSPGKVISNQEQSVENWFNTDRVRKEITATADSIVTKVIVEDGSAGTATQTDQVFDGSTVATVVTQDGSGIERGSQTVFGSLTVGDTTYDAGPDGMSIVEEGGIGPLRSVRSSMEVAADGSLRITDADASNNIESDAAFDATTGTANISETLDLPLLGSKVTELTSNPESATLNVEIESVDGRSVDSTDMTTAANSTEIVERDTSGKEQSENIATVRDGTVSVNSSTARQGTRDGIGRNADITERTTSVIGADGAISLAKIEDIDASRDAEDSRLVTVTNVNPEGQTVRVEVKTRHTPGLEPNAPTVVERLPLHSSEFPAPAAQPTQEPSEEELAVPPADESAALETPPAKQPVVEEPVVGTPPVEIPLIPSTSGVFEPSAMLDDPIVASIDDHDSGLQCPHLPVGSWDPDAPRCPTLICVKAPEDGSVAPRPDDVGDDATYVRLEFNGVLYDCWVPRGTSAIVV